MKMNIILAAAVFLGTMYPTVSAAQATELPENRVALVLDASGSFKSKLQDAIAGATLLLDQMANVAVKRWEPAKDRIVLVSMDALPEIIWAGSLQELKTLDPEHWKKAFDARVEYAKCTDVVKAIRIAANELNRDAGPKTNKYMFIYSDLVHEPPTTSIGQCAPINRTMPVPEDMPWEDLEGISITTIWIPIDQKFAWTKVIDDRGLEETFKLYASESEVREIQAPPRPDITPTNEETQQAREQMKQGLSVLGKAALALLAITLFLFTLVALILLVMLVWARFFRKPQPAPPVRRRGPRPFRSRPTTSRQPGPPRA